MSDLATGRHAIDPSSLSALPNAVGIYIFRGEGTLPLYIGKSLDIRSRVMAHLRADDEAAMWSQARRVDFIETAGEIGALLLEARLIKQLSPLFNIRLRRLRNLCSVRLNQGMGALSPEVVSARQVEFGQTDGLYGVFSSVHAAKLKLRDLADQNRLCLGLLGLEKVGARGCFGLQLKTCLGACVGREERAAHDRRLFSALQGLKVHTWPFEQAVDLVEARGAWQQRHRVDRWRHLGSWCSLSDRFEPLQQPGFDLDTYKILVRPVMLNLVRIEPARESA